MLCGLLRPTAGTARVLGREIPRDANALRRKIGYMTQRFSLYEELTVRENLDFMGEIYSLPPARREQRVEELLPSSTSIAPTSAPARSRAVRSSGSRSRRR
jgi:ABC-2 type transport system ATP-binding protein